MYDFQQTVSGKLLAKLNLEMCDAIELPNNWLPPEARDNRSEYTPFNQVFKLEKNKPETKEKSGKWYGQHVAQLVESGAFNNETNDHWQDED